MKMLLEIILRGGVNQYYLAIYQIFPYLIFWIILAYQYHKTMSMNKENRQSHQRTQDVRWKPNVGENHLLQYVSNFFQEILFTMILYWCSPLPVRRLQPAESYNSLSFSRLSWKGATTPYFFSWRIKWSTSIQQIQSTTDIRSVITETTQNTLWSEIYSQ